MEEKTIQYVKLIKFNLRRELDAGGYATLQWGVRMGFPRITVYTEPIKEDSKADYSKIITAPFDYITLGMLLEYFKEIVNGPSDNHKTVNCYNKEYSNGVATNNIILQAAVTVGKDKEGIIYIAVIEEGKKKIKFELLPSDVWFKFLDNLGNPVTDKTVLSKAYSSAYVNGLVTLYNKRLIVDSIKVNDAKPPLNKTTPNKTGGTLF